LRIVLEFAGRHFDRAAIFWLRDGEAQAMAQVGLASAGGPDDEALLELCVSVDESACFRKVCASRAPLRLTPEGEGDLALVARLGAATPTELYVAPIEAGEEVAALLYADNVFTRRPLGDTSALEVMLHEGGLALDRAVLERALEEVEAGRSPAAATPGNSEA
ncbi:MAG: response regulator, partial [Deltaproteobacteria bacterium]|nr:response regulator [Deltaproteobacteria bacterium]